MSYSSEQFRNFELYEGKGRSLGRTRQDNPQFIYPNNYRTNVFGDGNNQQVQRGFIRGIYPRAADSAIQRRLFFQFNPATLDRSAMMSETVLMPLLQDPANLLQPVPGMSTFSFELFFNREAEVNSQKFRSPNRTINDRPTNLLSDPTNTTVNPFDTYGNNWNPGDVSTIGVLADLYVLDSIIGQSLTPDLKQFIKEWNFPGGQARTNPTATEEDDSASVSLADFETRFDQNIGNSAFLAPLPIRMVFSSMFMVEGFVESSSVQFVKFTRNYVPTMCKVTLSIRALYFGFSKAEDKTFLSASIGEFLKAQDAGGGGGGGGAPGTTQGGNRVPTTNAGVISNLGITITPKYFRAGGPTPNSLSDRVSISGVPYVGSILNFKDYMERPGNKRFEGDITVIDNSGGRSFGDRTLNKNSSLKALVKTMTSADVRIYMEVYQVGATGSVIKEVVKVYSQELKVLNKLNGRPEVDSKSIIGDQALLRNVASNKTKFSWLSPATTSGSAATNRNQIKPDSEPVLPGSPVNINRKFVIVITAFIEVVTPNKNAKPKDPKFLSNRIVMSGRHELLGQSQSNWESLLDGKVSIVLRQDKQTPWRSGPIGARDRDF